MKLPLVSIVIGTRPEAIKLCPLILAFQRSESFKVRVILTGQHEDMVAKIMSLFGVIEDINLNILNKGQDLIDINCAVMVGLRKEFKKYFPDLLIVQGDTSSAYSSALTAFYYKIPIAHVEAGLRTNNLYDPFPEESNRRLISQLASLHFVPTNLAKINLHQSGIKKNVFLTGNTVIDALNSISRLEKKDEKLYENISCLDNLIFVTVHRRENWGGNIFKITKGIKFILDKHKDVNFLIALHPNQDIRDIFYKNFDGENRVIMTDPLDYDQLILILKKSKFVLTDSGGLQEEAPSLGKPVLILRETTERPEVIEAGTAKLIGTNPESIYKHCNLLLTSKENYDSMAKAINPFGDGTACEKILKICKDYFYKI